MRDHLTARVSMTEATHRPIHHVTTVGDVTVETVRHDLTGDRAPYETFTTGRVSLRAWTASIAFTNHRAEVASVRTEQRSAERRAA